LQVALRQFAQQIIETREKKRRPIRVAHCNGRFKKKPFNCPVEGPDPSESGEEGTRLELFLAGVAENADLPSLSKRILLPELGDERHEANLPYL
jgi:hypothetical protein